MPDFITGVRLNRLFYLRAVRPLLDKHFPDLPHAAATLGSSSEVTGFDTPMSRDHDWGPGVSLFLEDDAPHGRTILELVRRHLPLRFRGYPTHFGEAPGDPGTFVMADAGGKRLNHRVTVTTPEQFVRKQLNVNWQHPLSAADWLTFSAAAEGYYERRGLFRQRGRADGAAG